MSSGLSDDLAVRCRGLIKTYGSGPARVPALRGVDLDARQGELLLLIGPSGCGKTTLVSILAAILDPDEGDCEVLGHDLRRMREQERVRFRRNSIGFVFQVFNLLPALNAVENVAVPLLVAGVPRRAALNKARDLIDAVGLGKRAGALPAQLSGGQQQRVAIARAIVHEPHLIICDEPTSNLDHKTGIEMIDLLLRTARSAERALIVVTHDTRILELGDRVAHMDDGRIIDMHGAPEGESK